MNNEMVDIYTTTQGDTWDMIAHKIYGDEKYMTELMDANPDYVHTVFFSAGVQLIAPDITEPSPSTLPPWMRGGK